MPEATLVRNNRAFAQIEIPFDAAALSHHVYAASSPFEAFVERREFTPVDDPPGFARHAWPHAEFGYSDHGTTYLVKVTTETGAGESPLEAAPPLRIPTARGDEAIPLKLKVADGGKVLPNLLTAPTAVGEFIISVRDFARFRLAFDAVIGGATFIEFSIDTAEDRDGPFRIHQLTVPLGTGTVDFKPALFKVDGTRTGAHDIDIDQANFVRVRARSDAGATSELGLTIERIASRRRP